MSFNSPYMTDELREEMRKYFAKEDYIKKLEELNPPAKKEKK